MGEDVSKVDRKVDGIFFHVPYSGVGTRFWPMSRTSKPKQFLEKGSVVIKLNPSMLVPGVQSSPHARRRDVAFAHAKAAFAKPCGLAWSSFIALIASL